MNPGIGTCISSLLRKQLTKTRILEDKYEPWESTKLSLLPVRGNERSPGRIPSIQSGLFEDFTDFNAGLVVCVDCDCACELPLPVCPIHSASLINEVVSGEDSFAVYLVAVPSWRPSPRTTIYIFNTSRHISVPEAKMPFVPIFTRITSSKTGVQIKSLNH